MLEGKPIYRPRVEIRLSNKGRNIRLAMLVDSGADTSFIPLEVDEILDLDLTKRKTSRHTSGPFETSITSAYAELVKGTELIPLGMVVLIVPTDKIDDENLDNYTLLGRKEFLENLMSPLERTFEN